MTANIVIDVAKFENEAFYLLLLAVRRFIALLREGSDLEQERDLAQGWTIGRIQVRETCKRMVLQKRFSWIA